MATPQAWTYRGYLLSPSNSDPKSYMYWVAISINNNVKDTAFGSSWEGAFTQAKMKVDDILGVPHLKAAVPVAEPGVVEAPRPRVTVPEAPVAQSGFQINPEIDMPPITLDIDVFQRNWESHGWKLLIIGPTATWRQEWKEWEAIRDIIQNALDEGEAYTWGYNSDGMWIADKGRGINIADFLLGPPKLKPNFARGKFGEGMKVSAVVLMRRGYRIHVYTGTREIWIIYFLQDVGMATKAQTLAAIWRTIPQYNGTRFDIIGYHGQDFAEKFAVNIPKQDILQRTPAKLESPIKRFNAIYRGGGVIFCRDIYLSDIKSEYSYNLWGFDLAPDRHGPSNDSDVYLDIGRTWAYVTNPTMLDYFFKVATGEPGYENMYEHYNMSMNTYDLGHPHGITETYQQTMIANKKHWVDAFHRVCGNDAVVQTNSYLSSTVRYFGLVPISFGYQISEMMRKILPTDVQAIAAHQEELAKAQKVDANTLNKQQQLNLKLAQMMADRALYTSFKVYAAIIPNTPTGGIVEGLCELAFKEIYLSLNTLDTGKRTVEATIHEVAHAGSKANDLTSQHADAMITVSSVMFKAVSKGEFDVILKDENFLWD